MIMDDKLKGHIQCLIENFGLNATRHKDQERAMKEAKEVMEVIVKNCSIPDVSGCFSFAKCFKENYKFWRYTKDNKETYQSEISGKIMTEEEIFEHWKSNSR